MALTNAAPLCSVVSEVLHQTIKGRIKSLFEEMIAKDIEPLLEEYTRQIILEVAEMRDPYSVEGMKINVSFKLKENT